MVSMIHGALINMMAAVRREEGQSLAEYALILGLVVVGAIAILGILGADIITELTSVTDALG